MRAIVSALWISLCTFSNVYAGPRPQTRPSQKAPGLGQLMADTARAVKKLPEGPIQLPAYPGARSLKVLTRLGKPDAHGKMPAYSTSAVMLGQHHEGWATRDPLAKVKQFYGTRLKQAGYRVILDLPLGKNGRSWVYARSRDVVQIDFYRGEKSYQSYLERGQVAPRGTNGIFIYQKSYR